MSNYKKSNYAINKMRKGIVYRNADGSILEVTFEKIAKDDPNFTKEDFDKLKQLSDELYHEEEKADNLQAHYVKASLDDMGNDKLPAVDGIEEEMISRDTDQAYIDKFNDTVKSQLTEIQEKRLYLHCFGKLTVREIAKIEGSHYTVVAESIRAAKKKLKKFLRNF